MKSIFFFTKRKCLVVKAGTTTSLKWTDMSFCPLGYQGKVANEKCSFANTGPTTGPGLHQHWAKCWPDISQKVAGLFKKKSVTVEPVLATLTRFLGKVLLCQCWLKIVSKLHYIATWEMFSQNSLCVKPVHNLSNKNPAFNKTSQRDHVAYKSSVLSSPPCLFTPVSTRVKT